MCMRNDYSNGEAVFEARLPYEPPHLEFFRCASPLNILETVSLEGEIQDFQDGEDF